MTSESPAARSRPKTWLLVALGVVLVALLFTRMWSNGAPVGPRPAAPPRDAKAGQQAAQIDPTELKVRLEALEAAKPGQGDMERNPFRFQPKAPPPRVTPPRDPEEADPPTPPPPPQPPQAPPIPLRLMGFVDLPGGGKLAALSDCKGATFSAAEGKTVDGQYRLVKIGIESVTIEYISGKGRQTLRIEGCPPRDR
jgi:hypothetical protein